MKLYLFFVFIISLSFFIGNSSQEEINVKEVIDQIKEMFHFAYDNYMKYAFPKDELKPITCSGKDTFGGLTVTLIDTLDTLALFRNKSEFSKQVKWICSEIKSFDKDVNISVFETNIRVLGGLLSSHMLAINKELGLMEEMEYNGCLLNLAEDLAKRLMPAFESSKTGIPYGTVNLRYGVPKGETVITSIAGAGSFSLEFGILSRLTGNYKYELAALKAAEQIYERRSRLGLVGNHIDIDNGNWTHRDAGIGANIDSYYEYLLKSAILFGDKKYLDLFIPLYESAVQHLKKGNWYIEVEMESGIMTWPMFSTLQGFWPGLQVLYGDILPASKTMKSFMNIFNKNGFSPEGYNLASDTVQVGREGYPLRPELAESLYYLYQATGDSIWRSYGLDILHSIALMTRTKCGFARVEDVTRMVLGDLMDSFFLSETLKYLYLLFDDENFVNKQSSYIFTTEAHFFDISYFSNFKPTSNLSLHSSSAFCQFSQYLHLLSNDAFVFDYGTFPKRTPPLPPVTNTPPVINFNGKIDLNDAQNSFNQILKSLKIDPKNIKQVTFNTDPNKNSDFQNEPSLINIPNVDDLRNELSNIQFGETFDKQEILDRLNQQFVIDEFENNNNPNDLNLFQSIDNDVVNKEDLSSNFENDQHNHQQQDQQQDQSIQNEQTNQNNNININQIKGDQNNNQDFGQLVIVNDVEEEEAQPTPQVDSQKVSTQNKNSEVFNNPSKSEDENSQVNTDKN